MTENEIPTQRKRTETLLERIESSAFLIIDTDCTFRFHLIRVDLKEILVCHEDSVMPKVVVLDLIFGAMLMRLYNSQYNHNRIPVSNVECAIGLGRS